MLTQWNIGKKKLNIILRGILDVVILLFKEVTALMENKRNVNKINAAKTMEV